MSLGIGVPHRPVARLKSILLWIALVLCLWVGISVGAAARAATIQTACEAGSGWYMVGVRMRIGTWFDKIGPVCAQLQRDKSFSGHSLVAMYGGNGGAEPREIVCGPTEAITDFEALSGRYDAQGNYDVVQVNLTCSDLKSGAKRILSAKGTAEGVAFRASVTSPCPPGQIAFGLDLEYGAFVNQARSICAQYDPALRAANCPSGQVWRESFDGDSACVAPDQRYRLANGSCRAGYIWRESFEGDGVCVTPDQRFRKADGNCRAGYVWRESFDGDGVCVTPDQRYRRADGTCRAGYVWRDSFPGDGVCVTLAERAAANKRVVKTTGKAKIADAPAPAPAIAPAAVQVATATTNTDMYATSSGGDAICTMHTGDAANYLGADANWANLQATSGECAGKTGWVWHDPVNQPSLSLQ